MNVQISKVGQPFRPYKLEVLIESNEEFEILLRYFNKPNSYLIEAVNSENTAINSTKILSVLNQIHDKIYNLNSTPFDALTAEAILKRKYQEIGSYNMDDTHRIAAMEEYAKQFR